MPEQVIRFTEADKHRAAAAIFKRRFPTGKYMPNIDWWAYDDACAALAAAEGGEGDD